VKTLVQFKIIKLNSIEVPTGRPIVTTLWRIHHWKEMGCCCSCRKNLFVMSSLLVLLTC